MRETSVDRTYAIAFALLLHAIPLAFFLLAALWPGQDAASAGEPIQADVVDVNALSASMRSALRRQPEPLAEPEPATTQEPPPEPLPEPLEEQPEETPPEQQLTPQEQVPVPDETQQEEVVPDAESDDAAEREQEAKRQQGQRDLTENRETQEEIEQRRLSEMERQRQQQLADIRRQRADAARQASLSEERLRQLADRRAQQASDAAASAAPPPGNRGTENDPNAAYSKAIAEAIRRNWVRPDNILPSQRCRIVIRQLPGGEVIDAQVDSSCPYDELGKRSVEAAVLKAQPLPYVGYEKAFQRTLILNFQAEDR